MSLGESVRRWRRRRASHGLGRRLGELAFLAGAILLASVIVSAFAVVNLNNSVRRQVDRVDPAQVSAEQLDGALVNEETGVRGYALVRSKSLLYSFDLGVAEEQLATSRLSHDLVGDPVLVRDLRAAESAATAWRTRYAEPTLRAAAAGSSRPGASALLGRRLFRAFQTRTTRLISGLRAAHLSTTSGLSNADHTLIALLGICLLALLVVFEATWLLLRRWVTAPLLGLAGDVRQVASGEYERHLQATGAPEVRALAHDVDVMRAQILAELAEVEAARTALASQRAALERSNKDLEQFAYVASHDLQEPLRKMSSFSELVLRRYGGELDERGREFLTFIADGARRMQRLINDVLELSRVGRTERPFEPVDLTEAFTAARANLLSAIESTGAFVSAEKLPTVSGDITLLTILFQNLIANSLKFRSTAVPQVVVSASGAEGSWNIAVDDNGIGIEPQYAERIFAMFQRLHSRSEYPGTGLGLALCQRIVEHHGGRIWLDTTEQSGTRIVFSLPGNPSDEKVLPAEEAGAA